MAEFKLICPGCSAEYALPRDAIPPAGREVECSSCGHVWQAYPPAPEHPMDLGSFLRPRGEVQDNVARQLPPASKRLSADVLDILHGEVEFERRQRGADQQAEVHPTTDDIDWPATTVVMAAEKSSDGTERSSGPAVIRHAPARSEPRHTPPSAQEHRPAKRESAPRRAPIQPLAQPVRADRRGYRMGLALTLLAAAGVVAVYVLAPVLEMRGAPFSDQLMAWRAGLDELRIWLATTVRAI